MAADTGLGDIKVWNVVEKTSLTHGDLFPNMTVDGFLVDPDGMQCDVDGVLWSSGGWVGDEGHGVHIS